jgi:hypothetical protein
MSMKDVLMEIEQEVECHLQCETIEEKSSLVLWSNSFGAITV